MVTTSYIRAGLRRVMRAGGLLLAAGFIAGTPVGAQQTPDPTNLVFYTVLYADLDAAREAVVGLIGTEGQVFIDRGGSHLIVTAPPERQALVAQLLKGLDVVPLNVRIEVRFKRRDRNAERGGGIGGSARSGPTAAGWPSRINLKTRVKDDQSKETEEILQILLVQSGREATLKVGESVPYLDWFQEYGVNRGVYSREILWQEVGSFLTVQPQVIGSGPHIRLRITPELRGLVDHNPLRVKFSTVTTEVIVADGETVDLGGLGGNRDFYNRFLVGMGRENNEQSVEITLTPHLAGGP